MSEGMSHLVWMLRYVLLALRSRYEFTPLSAWQQASSSWDDSENGAMSPIDCFHEDAYEWSFG